MIHVVLMEPENPGNVGAVARVMQNFGFDKLILINPKADVKSSEAIARSKHASSILRKARIETKGCLQDFDCVVGTTARLGTDYNIPRSPITPRQLSEILPKRGETALLFGCEGKGLNNREVRACDFIVHIPTDSRYHALNLSHAVAVVLYELSYRRTETKLSRDFTPATRKEKSILIKQLDEVLSKMDFATQEKRETQRLVWRRMIHKSFLTRREAFALFGFFRKLRAKRL